MVQDNAVSSQEQIANEYDQNHADAISIYETLENEMVATFYDRDARGIPRNWLKMVRESICTVAPQFSMTRMIKEYTTQLYVPGME